MYLLLRHEWETCGESDLINIDSSIHSISLSNAHIRNGESKSRISGQERDGLSSGHVLPGLKKKKMPNLDILRLCPLCNQTRDFRVVEFTSTCVCGAALQLTPITPTPALIAPAPIPNPVPSPAQVSLIMFNDQY